MKKHSISLKTIRMKSPAFRLRGAALLAAALGMLPLSSCEHRLLLYGQGGSGGLAGYRSSRLQVSFDWGQSPGASPEGMSVYLFPLEGGDGLRFDLPGREGGPVSVPYGQYRALCVNNDTEYARLRGEGLSAMELHTRPASILEGMGMAPQEGAPVPPELDPGEPVNAAPDRAWAASAGPFAADASSDGDTLLLSPRPATTAVTCRISGVEHLSGVSSLSGSLSGMGEGYLLAAGQVSDSRVTVPFAATAYGDTLSAEFQVFGPRPDGRHRLSVYAVLADGRQWSYTFPEEEVTRQVREQAGQARIHIELRGLPLPPPASAGGMQPEVDEWEDAGDIVLPM